MMIRFIFLYPNDIWLNYPFLVVVTDRDQYLINAIYSIHDKAAVLLYIRV